MRLSNLKPFVPSGKYFKESKDFFKLLGFTENWGTDELCELQFGQVRFILQNYSNTELQENFMLYLNVDDLDSFWGFLDSLELKTLYPSVRYSKPEMRPWGIRELHLIDLAGVCWHFSQSE